MALVNQKTETRQGNVGPVLYALSAQQSPTDSNSSNPSGVCVFNDITVGSNVMPCKKGSLDCTTTNPADQYGVLSGYNAGVGFDLATGLGSVDVPNLVNADVWATNAAPDFTISSANATVTVPRPGSSGTLTLAINGVNGFSGTFDLKAASCSALPAGASCTFSPTRVSVDGASSLASVAVTIATTASGAIIPVGHASRRKHENLGTYGLTCIVLISVFVL